jgi:hypothetical protein
MSHFYTTEAKFGMASVQVEKIELSMAVCCNPNGFNGEDIAVGISRLNDGRLRIEVRIRIALHTNIGFRNARADLLVNYCSRPTERKRNARAIQSKLIAAFERPRAKSQPSINPQSLASSAKKVLEKTPSLSIFYGQHS